MSDREALAAGMRLAAQGRARDASSIFLRLVKTTRQIPIKLQAALGVVGTINPVDDNRTVLEMCDVGLEAAKQLGNTGAKAYLMAKKVVSLSFEVSQHRYQRRLLRLSPAWKGFSLEADQAEYQRLTGLIDDHERQCHELLTQALQLSEGVGDHGVRGHILMMRGDFYCSRYSDLKLEHLRDVRRLQLLRLFHREDLAYSRRERKELHQNLSQCEESYSEAIRLFEALGDEANLAMALHNFANQLRTSNRFTQASDYLSRARALGVKLNDQGLLTKADVLEKRIRSRNRDIPNYVGGER